MENGLCSSDLYFEERIKEIEAKWAIESEERIDAVDRGQLPTIDGPPALREIRSSLKVFSLT